ncbi:MAG: DJ-1/PfpI family protein [Candidatus Sumerlaeia bacterium]|nr:DJ-1/PfpI family protein [Candidatus Sumerlaeia bacterium]
MKQNFITLAAILATIPFAGLASADRVLMVVTNHGELGDTGEKTGYFLSEVSHPHQELVKAGHEIVFASPKGGYAPMDPKSHDMDDPINAAFWEKHQEDLSSTVALSEVDPANFRAVVFAGGHGTMWDFPGNEDINRVTSAIYEGGGVVAAVCHGPAALVSVKLSNGRHLVDGRRVAAFTNAEEEAVELTEVMPFLLETTLRSRGATVDRAENFQEKVVVDGRLVTGQNPASATGMGREVARVLGELKERDASAPALLSIPFETMDGDTSTLGGDYHGQVVLIVNTASRCGLTPQYEGLQGLHEKYGEKGFTVIAFPSNDYGGQEPGTNEDILEFCEENFGVTFPVMAKKTTRGEGISPLYAALTGEGAPDAGPINWNFEKFLIGRDGTILNRFNPRVTPTDPALVGALEKALETARP